MSGGILVIAETRRGELRPVSLELIGAALGLHASVGGPLAVAVPAPQAARFVPSLSVAGVTEVIPVDLATDFDPDLFEAALGALILEREPAVVLLAHSVDSFGYAAALAARHGFGFATDVFSVERIDGDLVATRGGYGQKVHVEVDFPGRSTVLLALRASVWKPPAGASAPTVNAFAAPEVHSRSVAREYIEPPGGDDVDMAAAEFILTIGRGIG
jgi:electron transfer flavoprotein alpha subunit